MVEITNFGTAKDGREIRLYTIKNQNGMQVAVTNLGAALVKLLVPDANGKVDDLVLGFGSGEEYYNNISFLGAVIGPNANRIEGGSFDINGEKIQLPVNESGNNLHSDFDKGYLKRYWFAQVGDNNVTFFLTDEDGDLGLPGNRVVQLTYTLTDDNALELHYHATSDKKTVINLTNHTYFNLDGHASGSIEDHVLTLNCSRFTPVARGGIPTGDMTPVEGTVMDFRKPKTIGQDINAPYEQLLLGQGYDHNWIVDDYDKTLRHFATVKGPKSGRVMKAYTTLPGVQFYAGNFIANIKGKDGVTYAPRMGFCLETQFFPDTVHHRNFPSCFFGGEKEYDSVTIYRFE